MADENGRPVHVTPQRWWQWLIMFPAILAPLYTAIPVWTDKAVAAFREYASGSARIAEQQLALASRNTSCLQAPYNYYESSSRLSIDGTVCRTGDVLLRAMDERQRQAIYFVSSDVIRERVELSEPTGNFRPAAFGLGTPSDMAAFVRKATWSHDVAEPAEPLQLAQYQVVVLCSYRLDGRFLRQRIRRPDGCFDITIDLANGAVVESRPSSCAPC